MVVRRRNIGKGKMIDKVMSKKEIKKKRYIFMGLAKSWIKTQSQK